MGGPGNSRGGEVERTDEALIEAANRGDEAAFAELYHRHKDWAFRVALRFTGDHGEAADAVQEAFLYVLRKVPHLRLTAQLRTWLYPVVRNTTIRLRDKRRRLGGGEPLEAAAADERRGDDDLSGVVASLSEEQREVVLLRFVDGLTLEEIATVQGVPVGTVKSRLHHALARLREDPRTRRHFLGE